MIEEWVGTMEEWDDEKSEAGVWASMHILSDEAKKTECVAIRTDKIMQVEWVSGKVDTREMLTIFFPTETVIKGNTNSPSILKV